jgi:hypothetical protein
MKKMRHQCDCCVVGGGMAGMIAAITAARHGASVVLVHDRPVLGGNASSEIRMHICGAHGKDRRETGILEEILLENHYRNPTASYSVWDSVLYGKAQYQDNLKLLLNCSVNACEMAVVSGNEKPRIQSVTGWQGTAETWHTIQAGLFVDASGDGILAPLSGADFRIGREARAEFKESIAPETADQCTMGLSCLIQAREYPNPQPFIAPDWAYKFTKPEDLNGRSVNLMRTNYWWIEVGGDKDSIHDTEVLREDLVRIAYGVWDYIKNYAPDREIATNWALDWNGFLPGKRESRRYMGDHILTQNDVESEGRFEDVVAYGGWTMDDHYPAGFYHPKAGTIFHPAPSPYGIPYRSLYSRNIANLFCAGRNHSATHAAMSSTRVMATTSLMGQAVGTAAAIAAREKTSPRGVYENHLAELQDNLMADDCWLPWRTRSVARLSLQAKLDADSGDAEPLRSGIDRPIDDHEHAWSGSLNTAVTYTFSDIEAVHGVRLVFDSDLNRDARNMPSRHHLNAQWRPPATLVKAFRIEGCDANGNWKVLHAESSNYQRFVRVKLNCQVRAIRLIPESTWGSETCRIFSFEVL